jgi:hypothetical protein
MGTALQFGMPMINGWSEHTSELVQAGQKRQEELQHSSPPILSKGNLVTGSLNTTTLSICSSTYAGGPPFSRPSDTR